MIQVLSDPKAREKPCLRCQVSLRGNLDATHCPNCGLSVWLSLNQNDALDWSSPSWLGRLSLASAGMAACQVVGLVAWVLLMVPLGSAARVYALGCLVAGAYFVLYHAFMLLALADERRHPDRLRSIRQSAMLAVTGGVLLGAMLLWLGAARLGDGWPMPSDPRRPMSAAGLENFDPASLRPANPGQPWVFLSEAVLAGSVLATWAMFRKLAQRVPSGPVARLCSWLLLAPLLTLFKTFPFFALFVGWQFAWVLLYAPIVYFPATAVLLAWFVPKFRRAAVNATEHWDRETSPAFRSP